MFHGLPPRPLRSISCHHALEPNRGSAAWAAALRTKMSVDTVNRAEKMAFILPSLSCIRRYRHGPWLPCSFTSPHSGPHLSSQGGNRWRRKELSRGSMVRDGSRDVLSSLGEPHGPLLHPMWCKWRFGDAKNMPRGVPGIPNSRAEALGSVGRVLLPTHTTYNPLRFEFALPSSVKLSGDWVAEACGSFGPDKTSMTSLGAQVRSAVRTTSVGARKLLRLDARELGVSISLARRRC